MNRRSPDPALRDVRVRHLVGHPDRDRDVCEVGIDRRLVLGEAEAAGRRRVVQAGVSKRIDGVDDRPAEDHARDGEDRERDAKAAFGPPGLRERRRGRLGNARAEAQRETLLCVFCGPTATNR